MSFWTDTHGAYALQLWEAGESARTISDKISAQLKATVSRNSVIGHITRQRDKGNPLARKTSAAAAGRAASFVRKLKSDTASAQNIGRTTRSDGTPVSTAPPQPIVERPAQGAPAPKMLGMHQLTGHTCKWPIGDPRDEAFAFCGHRTAIGSAFPMYCGGHGRLATNPHVKKKSPDKIEQEIARADRARAA